MKAVVCTKHGPPEVLQLKEVAKPIPKDMADYAFTWICVTRPTS